MFGGAARIVTGMESSLPALQELPSHQEPVGRQAKTAKKAGRWSRFGKFKVDTKKALGHDHRSTSTKKHRDDAIKPRKKTPYELRDQELKIDEGRRARSKVINWKKRQQQKTREED